MAEINSKDIILGELLKIPESLAFKPTRFGELGLSRALIHKHLTWLVEDGSIERLDNPGHHPRYRIRNRDRIADALVSHATRSTRNVSFPNEFRYITKERLERFSKTSELLIALRAINAPYATDIIAMFVDRLEFEAKQYKLLISYIKNKEQTPKKAAQSLENETHWNANYAACKDAIPMAEHEWINAVLSRCSQLTGEK